jgi:hypothetical protein
MGRWRSVVRSSELRSRLALAITALLTITALLIAATAAVVPASPAVSLSSAHDSVARIVGAGKVYTSCVTPGPGCTPDSEVPVAYSTSADNRRVAVLYGDGHSVVFDVARHEALLATPAQPPAGTAGLASGMWISNDGNVLALEVGDNASSYVETQLWSVPERHVVETFPFAMSWVLTDDPHERTLILPNSAPYPISLVSLAPPKVLAVMPQLPRPPNLPEGELWNGAVAASSVAFNASSHEYVFASDAVYGFVTWAPTTGAKVKETDGNCYRSGTLSSDARLFLCASAGGSASGATSDYLAVWDVASHRKLDQWRLHSEDPNFPAGSPVLVDHNTEVAVPVGRASRADQIDVYDLSDHNLVDTILLRPPSSEYSPVRLTTIGNDLVVNEDVGPNNRGMGKSEWWTAVYRIG